MPGNWTEIDCFKNTMPIKMRRKNHKKKSKKRKKERKKERNQRHRTFFYMVTHKTYILHLK